MIDVLIPVSAGELLDRISILEIKKQLFDDPAALSNVQHELERLYHTRRLLDAYDLSDLMLALSQINQKLWQIEEDLRACERQGIFDQRFIDLARQVYINNDERSGLKREINRRVGSTIQEEKNYATGTAR